MLLLRPCLQFHWTPLEGAAGHDAPQCYRQILCIWPTFSVSLSSGSRRSLLRLPWILLPTAGVYCYSGPVHHSILSITPSSLPLHHSILFSSPSLHPLFLSIPSSCPSLQHHLLSILSILSSFPSSPPSLHSHCSWNVQRQFYREGPSQCS